MRRPASPHRAASRRGVRAARLKRCRFIGAAAGLVGEAAPARARQPCESSCPEATRWNFRAPRRAVLVVGPSAPVAPLDDVDAADAATTGGVFTAGGAAARPSMKSASRRRLSRAAPTWWQGASGAAESYRRGAGRRPPRPAREQRMLGRVALQLSSAAGCARRGRMSPLALAPPQAAQLALQQQRPWPDVAGRRRRQAWPACPSRRCGHRKKWQPFCDGLGSCTLPEL